ncbi:uncharacterized protein LOC128761007 [Synchiropus splendidus]|uniref:uncharacterized protein LOC128761007 n=1 Tax=Synchiropus splendidus TaxID=270530 RepID=UPI00237E2F68|nr:uncharacterized protein LOC128761007 [Synchiropus splendidus]
MWMPVLIFIATWILEGSTAEYLEVSPSDWLEFSCDDQEQGHHMRCDVYVRCSGTPRQEDWLPCNSTICINIGSTRRKDTPEVDSESGEDVRNITVQDPVEMHVKDPGCEDEILTFMVMVTGEGSFSHSFVFKSKTYVEKFLCKGRDELSCRFLDLHNNDSSSNISLHMREVNKEDLSIYWYGVKGASHPQDWFFFLRFALVVVPSLSPRLPVVTSNNSDVHGGTSARLKDGAVLLICGLVLSVIMLLLVSLLVYKGHITAFDITGGKSINSQNKKRILFVLSSSAVCSQKHRCGEDGESEDVNEVNDSNMNNYEEILPGNVAKTIYVTAHFSTNHHHPSDGNSTVTLKRSDYSTEHLYSTLSPPLQ